MFIFVRSLDPFALVQNLFLRTDPLIFLTHPDARPLWLIPPLLLLALTLVLGRYFCGWICPLGSLIEILDLLLKPLRNLNPWKLRLSSGRIGRAFIDQEKCVVYAKQIDCIVCEEMCPIPHKAVLLIEKEGLKYPIVVSRCIGCGICEAFCPVDPRAITVRKV